MYYWPRPVDLHIKGLNQLGANITVKGGYCISKVKELRGSHIYLGGQFGSSVLATCNVLMAAVLAKGETVFQETRLWNEAKELTEVMRQKEEAHDYRYFPEPDLLDFTVSAQCIDEQREKIKELPQARRARFLAEYQLSEKETDIIISNIWMADFFEAAGRYFNDYKKLSGWLLGPLLEQVNLLPQQEKDVKISPANFAKVVKYFSEDKLNNLAAKKVLSLAVNNDRDIDDIIKEQGLVQLSDQDALAGFISQAVKDNPKPVQEYLAGKDKAIMFLVGQVMKQSKGKANPKVVRELLEKAIKG